MPNLRRRIEALEKSTSAKCDVLHAMAHRALQWLWPEDVELLISAYGADRVGRKLTERESAARRAYASALARECQGAGLAWSGGLDCTPNIATIQHAILMVLAHRISREDLESARLAAQQGRPPTERELAAAHACGSLLQRLCRQAGFGSRAEFESFRTRPERRQGGRPC